MFILTQIVWNEVHQYSIQQLKSPILYHLHFSTTTVATLKFALHLGAVNISVQIPGNYSFHATVDVLLCSTAWYCLAQCAYANSKETSRLDSVHNTQDDVTITQTGNRQYGRLNGHASLPLPPNSLLTNSKTPARIKFLYSIFKNIL